MRVSTRLIAVGVGLTLLCAFLNPGSALGFGESNVAVDTEGFVGTYASLALDASGYPVVSYFHENDLDLKILHCNDRQCAGNNESITTPHATGAVGYFSSLTLDSAGNPVVSYVDFSTQALTILHCDDPNCGPGGDSIETPDGVTGGTLGATSIALDSSGNQVVGYAHTVSGGGVRILDCNDANCDDAVNGTETIEEPVTGGFPSDPSLELDAGGNPVVSFRAAGPNDLMLLHCDDPNCMGDTAETVDINGVVQGPSLELDSIGKPIISYGTATGLRLVHCNDANCAGNDETPSILPLPNAMETSVSLDSLGRPVVSYLISTTGDLALLHCNDADCSGGDDLPSFVDLAGYTGQKSSLALDEFGIPVVAYYGVDQDLRLLRCADATCSRSASTTSPDTAGDVGLYTSITIDSAGDPVVAYYDDTNDTLKILHCNDINCAGGDDSITMPDPTTDNVGLDTSIALDSAGNPVVSYSDVTNDALKIMHCNDPDCDPSVNGAESITSPVTGIGTGSGLAHHSSLVLDGSGRPVVAFHDRATVKLRILHCNDVNCAGGGDPASSPAPPGDTGKYASVEMDGINPVVSYYEATDGDLKVLHCADPNCTAVKSTHTPDSFGDVGVSTSLELDAAGNPVVSYQDRSNQRLMLLHCNDRHCAPGGDSKVEADNGPVGAAWTSLALDAAGNPAIAYSESAHQDLRVLRCNDPNCTGGGERISQPDGPGVVGTYPAIALDSRGVAAVSYHNETTRDLKVLRCVGCGVDLDLDGCADDRELQPKGSVASGGGRSPKNFWDFFDTPDDSNVRDRAVAGTDFFRILARFGAVGSASIDPLSMPPAAPAYHTAFDRGASSGPNPWNLTAADGSIAGTDFFAILAQFGHSCA